MQGRNAVRITITASATACGLAAAGCGGDSTTSTTSSAKITSTQAASVEEIVDRHPKAVTVVCRSTEPSEHEHSGHEHSGHEHSHHEEAPRVAELEAKAFGHVGPLAVEGDVAPADLLDEFVSRC
jgi:hypothetical protein